MRQFQIENEEAYPLTWQGDIVLKRPCQFTEEEYKTYFNEKMISLKDLNRYMSEPELSIFHRVPVWVLKDEYKDQIKKDILNGILKNVDTFPKWTLNYTSRDKNDDYWSFNELRPNRKEQVVEWMLEPKNGLCEGSTVGSLMMKYNVNMDDPVRNGSDLVGTITLDCVPFPESCKYTYDSLGCASLSPLDPTQTLSTLPPKIEECEESILFHVEEICDELSVDAASLDEAIKDATDISDNQITENYSSFFIDDSYWDR